MSDRNYNNVPAGFLELSEIERESESNIFKLNSVYSDFFKHKFMFIALSPYIVADVIGGNLFSRENSDGSFNRVNGEQAGKYTIIALSIVPVLPILTLLTITIALLIAVVTALSALIVYPFAAAADAIHYSRDISYFNNNP